MTRRTGPDSAVRRDLIKNTHSHIHKHFDRGGVEAGRCTISLARDNAELIILWYGMVRYAAAVRESTRNGPTNSSIVRNLYGKRGMEVKSEFG